MGVQKKLRFSKTVEKITSPFFKPVLSCSKRKMDDVLSALDVLSIGNNVPKSSKIRLCSGFIFFPDLFELQHTVSIEDQAMSANAFRLSAHLKSAEITFSEIVSAYAYCHGNDESSKWLDDLSFVESSREDYINRLIYRTKELMVECHLDLHILENMKTPVLVTDDTNDLIDTKEMEDWLLQKSEDIANARFAGLDDRKDVAIVFNHHDSSFLEVNSTSMYRENIHMSCVDINGHACLVDMPHRKTMETSHILKEISTRYISDDDYVYIYKNCSAEQGELTEAYLHITDSVMFLWFSYA